MKKIFTGAETVNDIFRQIESGKVWDRNIGEQRTKQATDHYIKPNILLALLRIRLISIGS